MFAKRTHLGSHRPGKEQNLASPPVPPPTTAPPLPIEETTILTFTVIHCTVFFIALLNSVQIPKHHSLNFPPQTSHI